MSHWVRPHYRNGRYVRGHWRRNPGKVAAAGVSVTVVIGGASWAGDGLLTPKAGKPAAPRAVGGALSSDAQAGITRARVALEASHYGTKVSISFGTDCAGRSEGRVREFLRTNPCKGMARGLVQLGEIDRDLVLVAVSWVEMPDAATAHGYKDLVDANAGKITELSREMPLLRGISFENRTFMTGLKGTFVWNVEVKPQSPTMSDTVINGILEDSRQQ
ncbi:hypothetical protein [Actinomadura rupiterrae]|uniref:hypothetical protein n=1 Tax=Actinomadura rupiterrae TaxID=559627 RepID=UPI0020A42940|nr:hypothetical protein [Actinomadura rupiterrae]MCP2338728.1 hypothetical protein [Actinomadura rupiterrae]